MSDKIYREVAELLNSSPKLADTMDLEQLGALLEVAEEAYYNTDDGSESILDDVVYDYAKEAYDRRKEAASKPKPKGIVVKIGAAKTPVPPPIVAAAPKGMVVKISKPAVAIAKITAAPAPAPAVVAAVSKATVAMPELSHVPKPRGPLVKLPFWMGSMDKMLDGEGHVSRWTAKYGGPYVVTAKIDGVSALYIGSEKKLYSRGKGMMGQDLSHLLPYLHLPDVSYAVRGELVVKNSVFDSKYKKSSADDTTPGRYRNGRNAVSGLINSKPTNYNKEFAAELEFIVYEIIPASGAAMKPSKQLDTLEADGFNVVPHNTVDHVSDEVLFDEMDEYIEGIDYNIDGLVVYNDQTYYRNTSENPEYAQAYKKPLKSLMATSTVVSVEWNASRYGYLKPTVLIESVEVDGVTISRATGINAEFIVNGQIGPGSVVEIVRGGGVTPKIVDVITGTGAQMPKVSYKWNDTRKDILIDQEAEQDDESLSTKRDIAVQKLYFFIETIGAKGIGEATTGKIFDAGFKKIPDLFKLKASDLAFLGAKTGLNVVTAIKTAMTSVTLPTLMAASGAFGRGIGVRKFAAILNKYPALIDSDEVQTEDWDSLARMIQLVDGFAAKTAKVVADGMGPFMKFLYELPEDIVLDVINYTDEVESEKSEAAAKGAALSGKNICLTGFRDSEIQKFIESSGGKVQSAVSGTTNILIIKDASYSNKKTQTAAEKGTTIMTRDEFVAAYMN